MPYPPLEPYDGGMLDVGDGQRIRWEVSGNPDGRAAVALHGGPGSGCPPWWRELFDPAAYRIVLFDQRGAGGSLPDAADPDTDLSVNTTHHLIGDIERLRAHLGIERWLVIGASWGTTLALAYAQRHPARVTELVLFSVGTTTRREVEWLTRGVGPRFPARVGALRRRRPRRAEPRRRLRAGAGGPGPARAGRARLVRVGGHARRRRARPALRRPTVPAPLRAPRHPLLGQRRVARGDRAARRHAAAGRDPGRADPRAAGRELAARRPRRARAGAGRTPSSS